MTLPNKISCPNCKTKFLVPLAVIERIERSFERSYGQKLKEQEIAISRLSNSSLRFQATARSVSGEIAGTVFENDLEEHLRSHFKTDEIKRLVRGKSGADVYQHVLTNRGDTAGILVWEAKQTIKWSNLWVKKLQKNVEETEKTENARAIGVIVTDSLPGGITHLGLHRDVWVTTFDCVIGLAHAMRNAILQIDREKKLARVKKSAYQSIFEYVTGKEFSTHVVTAISAIAEMRTDLANERKQMDRMWTLRERRLAQATNSLQGLCGDLSRIDIPLQVPKIDGKRDDDILLLPK